MILSKDKNKIVIQNEHDFSIMQILECGQVFSFQKIDENTCYVVSMDKFAKITFDDCITTIYSKNLDYFYNYFDLNTDYEKIKEKILNKYKDFSVYFLNGNAIRILHQDALQTIISFIVSANNNIKRIKKILNNLCRDYGVVLEKDIFSFPNLEQLSKITVEDFTRLGAGYRAKYLYESIKKLQTEEYDINYLNSLTTIQLKEKLLSLDGVGPKVADCILFFGFNRKDVFPVDTWIRKAYRLFSNEKKNDRQISSYFVNMFGDVSGYAQQYIFNYMITKDKTTK